MRPLRELSAVTPDTAVTAAMEIMNSKDLNQLPVVRNGHIEGLVTRGGLLRLLQTRAELEM